MVVGGFVWIRKFELFLLVLIWFYVVFVVYGCVRLLKVGFLCFGLFVGVDLVCVGAI